MHDAVLNHTALRAEVLADALVDTVGELRLIEPGDLIGYIHGQNWATISDLVQSSTELSFREGAISFAAMAECQIGWVSPLSISLDLEFQGRGVSVFFTLILERRESLIEIKHVWFACPPDSEAEGTDQLARSLADARLAEPHA